MEEKMVPCTSTHEWLRRFAPHTLRDACYLYRHFDENMKLLYVGISRSAMYRLDRHKRQSPWFHKITTVTIKLYPSRQEAIDAERKAIQEEVPLYNKTHQRKKSIFDF